MFRHIFAIKPQVKLTEDSESRGPDPFMGQNDPEMVIQWSGVDLQITLDLEIMI